MTLDHPALVLIRDDVVTLLIAPDAEGVGKDIASRRLLSLFFSLPSGDLTGFFQSHLGEVSEFDIRHPSEGA